MRYAPIVGKLCEIPVGPKEHRRLIPIITDEYPDPDFGSGAVKITGAHDFNDYAVASRGGIPMYRLMDTRAQMRADGEPYAVAAAIAMDVAQGKTSLSEAEADALNLVPDDLRGLDRFEARKAVVEQITSEGLAVMIPNPQHDAAEEIEGDQTEEPSHIPLVEAKPIMQPFGDRSKVVIEPMLTDQWFVDADKIVGPALDAVRSGAVKILPESGEKTYYHWLENIEPWCISRQLWWGHQIPVWYGFDLSGEGFSDDEGDGALDEVEIARLLSHQTLLSGDERHHCAADAAHAGAQFADVLVSLPTPLNHARVTEVEDRETALHTIAASLAQYNLSQDPTDLVYPIWRDPDVLDTWFSSGLWPIGTLGWPEDTPELAKYFPTSTLITGQDILFFWVARMMMMQIAVTGQVPFHEVYLHGLVRDAKGKKMSKSVGNVVDPLEVIDEYGADALRFSSAAMAALGGVLKLDMERIKGYRNFTTKLWNAARFAEMNGVFTPDAPRPTAPRLQSDAQQTVNRWIVGETAKVRESVDDALANYRFNDAANALYAFVWGKVCDWYLEFAKPLFASEDQAVVEETRATMAWVLDQCFILLHPITPYITEELWGTTAKREKLCVHADWPTYTAAELVDPQADREMNWVIDLIEQIRSVRAQMRVPVGLYVPVLQLDLDDAGRTAYASNETLIKRLARIEGVTEAAEPPKGALTIAVDGGTFALPLADIIDVAEEKARLEKVVGKLEKELGGLRGRLGNEKFLASAPEEVVAENRARLATGDEELATLKAAIGRLAEVV
jgi:valyl-tRNA synthetase